MTNSFLIRHRAVSTLVFILATSLAGFASVIGTFDRSFQVNGNVDLEAVSYTHLLVAVIPSCTPFTTRPSCW